CYFLIMKLIYQYVTGTALLLGAWLTASFIYVYPRANFQADGGGERDDKQETARFDLLDRERRLGR
ncbi:MAG: hypothetical protein ACQKBY_10390, partial [Verrucomicrobiales bacterium]